MKIVSYNFWLNWKQKRATKFTREALQKTSSRFNFSNFKIKFCICIWGHSHFSLTKLMLSKVHGNLHKNANSTLVHSQNIIVLTQELILCSTARSQGSLF